MHTKIIYDVVKMASGHKKIIFQHLKIIPGHHNFNTHQALSDLKRTYFSFMKGNLAIRIPNSLVRYHLDQTADLITEMLKKNKPKSYYQ